MTLIRCPHCEGSGKSAISDAAEQVLQCVNRRKPIGAADIARKLDLKIDVVGHRLLDLWQDGLIDRTETKPYLYIRK